jgi:hypothetical protein
MQSFEAAPLFCFAHFDKKLPIGLMNWAAVRFKLKKIKVRDPINRVALTWLRAVH